ncbi:MAG TPA: hypothetical protein VK524_06415 [Polyangiaceae bacterium]|nr:hypothetical protein [Polyangiaceae bacterium]
MRSLGAAALLVASVSACASDRDANSRRLFGLSQLATEPQGALAVSDDGTYVFTDYSQERESRGELTDAERGALKPHVSRSALARMYAQATPDGQRCQTQSGAYIVDSALGSACFVVDEIADAEAKSRLEFLIALYVSKAASAK